MSNKASTEKINAKKITNKILSVFNVTSDGGKTTWGEAPNGRKYLIINLELASFSKEPFEQEEIPFYE